MPAPYGPTPRDHGQRSLSQGGELIEATGATLLFLPPYSPDFNPIEQDFAALKKCREYQDQATLDEIAKAYQ